jgi:transcriptional regulator with XRE-family HTH domain
MEETNVWIRKRLSGIGAASATRVGRAHPGAVGAALHWWAQHISSIERGVRPIRLDYLTAIDRVFNCDYATLYRLLLRAERAPVWLRP